MNLYKKQIRTIDLDLCEELGFKKNPQGYYIPGKRTIKEINAKYRAMIDPILAKREQELKTFIDLNWNFREHLRAKSETVDPNEQIARWYDEKIKELDVILADEDKRISETDDFEKRFKESMDEAGMTFN